MITQQLHKSFASTFPDSGEPRFFYAPGRVNLIGEHIDYNGGYVFPCALTLGTYAAISRRDDNTVRLVSGNFGPAVTITTDDLQFDPAHKWANNPKAIIKLLTDMGHKIGGFDLYIWGNLPGAAGLSSSASINVLVTLALDALYEVNMSPVDRALLSQRAENEYLGVNCGIMDPFASAMGKKNHAILLNCGSLEYDQVPLELGDYRLMLANTNKPRALADSKYNERRTECDKALGILRSICDIENLCDLEFDEQFIDISKKAFGEDAVNHVISMATTKKCTNMSNEHIKLKPEEIAFKRAYHAVSENTRVKKAVDMLRRGDLAAFGSAMSDSHTSLRDFYEVTGDELDALVLAANELDVSNNKVLGSRMTGAGFGGCTVSIVHKNNVDEFICEVGMRYTKMTGLSADFYVAETDDGAREICAHV